MTRSKKTIMLTQLSLLTAVEIILAFTPLGFIMIPPVAITLMHIPVVVGAILLGPLGGGILGGVFGICSMIKATTAASSPVDMAFSPFLCSQVGGNPITSIIMTVGARILLGVFTALLFNAFSKLFRNNSFSISASAILGTLLHTVMVLGCLALFFSNLGIGWGAILTTVASLNGILEIAAAGLVSVAVCKPLMSYLNKNK